jgi:hypothetical protein
MNASVEYRGYSIWPNTKTKYHSNRVSGHTWSTQEPASGFYIAGPHASVCETFKTVKRAQEHVDYLINTWSRPRWDTH